MTKKKSGKKVAKKAPFRNLLGSKKSLFLLALVTAVLVVAGVTMFAGGAATKGRVFSWKKLTVEENYRIFDTNPAPEAYQHVLYKHADWKGGYWGVYTEKTTPLYASRNLEVGMSGEDVVVLKKALEYIGKGYVLPPTKDHKTALAIAPVTIGSRCPAITKVSATNVFDQTVVDAITGCLGSGKISTEWDSYADSKGKVSLNKYRLVRILTLATHPGLLSDRGVKFSLQTGNIGDGRVYTQAEMSAVNDTVDSGAAKETEVEGAAAEEAAPVEEDVTSDVQDVSTEEIDAGDEESLSAAGMLIPVAHANATKWYFKKFNYNGQKSYGKSPVNLSSGVGFVSPRVHLATPFKRSFTASLKRGNGVMSGDDVRQAQLMLLHIKSKYSGAFKFTGLKANGNYDKATKDAVKEYKKFKSGSTSSTHERINGQTLQLMFNDITWPVYR